MNDWEEQTVVCPYFARKGKEDTEIRCAVNAPGVKRFTLTFVSLRRRAEYRERYCKDMKAFYKCPACQVVYAQENRCTLVAAAEELKKLYGGAG